MSKHIFILLDVDDTLVIFKQCTDEKIVLTGGKHHWSKTLRHLRKELQKVGIIVHYGIATAKPQFIDAEYKKLNKRGDRITGGLLEEKSWLENTPPEQCINYGLKELFDPELIFFVGEHIETANKKYNASQIDAEEYSKEFYKVKVDYALRAAKSILEKRFNITLSNADGYLIDNEASICQAVNAAGFNGWCVDGLIDKNKQSQKDFITCLVLGEDFCSLNNSNNNNNHNDDTALFESIAKQILQDLAKGNNTSSKNTSDDIPQITLNQNSFFHAGLNNNTSNANNSLLKRLGVPVGGPNKRIKLDNPITQEPENKIDSAKSFKS